MFGSFDLILVFLVVYACYSKLARETQILRAQITRLELRVGLEASRAAPAYAEERRSVLETNRTLGFVARSAAALLTLVGAVFALKLSDGPLSLSDEHAWMAYSALIVGVLSFLAVVRFLPRALERRVPACPSCNGAGGVSPCVQCGLLLE